MTRRRISWSSSTWALAACTAAADEDGTWAEAARDQLPAIVAELAD